MSLGHSTFDQDVAPLAITPDQAAIARVRIRHAATNPAEAAMFLDAIQPTPNTPTRTTNRRRALPRRGNEA